MLGQTGLSWINEHVTRLELSCKIDDRIMMTGAAERDIIHDADYTVLNLNAVWTVDAVQSSLRNHNNSEQIATWWHAALIDSQVKRTRVNHSCQIKLVTEADHAYRHWVEWHSAVPTYNDGRYNIGHRVIDRIWRHIDTTDVMTSFDWWKHISHNHQTTVDRMAAADTVDITNLQLSHNLVLFLIQLAA